MYQCIDSLVDAKVIFWMDGNCGYCQIEIAEEGRDKTAFTSHHGLYQFVRVPCGLKNAHITFHRPIEVILVTVWWKHALVYLDAVVVFSKSADEHIAHVRSVLTLV